MTKRFAAKLEDLPNLERLSGALDLSKKQTVVTALIVLSEVADNNCDIVRPDGTKVCFPGVNNPFKSES